MGRSQEHDWLMAEKDFVIALEKCTLKDIADRYNIPHQSVRRYAVKHSWNQKRKFTRCMIRNLTQMKFLELRYGLTVKDIINDERVTWSDLAYLQCSYLDPDQKDASL